MNMPSALQAAMPDDARWTEAATGVRFGLKGSGAPDWLRSNGIDVPAQVNSVQRWSGGRCLRLGQGEFLVELDEAGALQPSPAVASEGVPETWMLLRSDHCVLLEGAGWLQRLALACSFDLQQLRHSPDLVVMTLFAGISVTLILEPASTTPSTDADASFALRLWCDASYATYLDHCLQQLASPLGDAS